MILGRHHLILLSDTESQNSSKQIWSVLVGTNYLSFHMIDRGWIFGLITIFSRLETNNNNLGFSGAVFALSRHVKLVYSGTDNIPYCLVLYATGTLTFDSIVM